MTQPSFDKAKAKAFTQKVLDDTSGLAATIMAYIGDRLGLFKALDGHGPLTSAELAERANVNERYAREWLHGMTSAGYLAYDPQTKLFSLPAEHRSVLAQENARVFMGGVHQFLISTLGVIE